MYFSIRTRISSVKWLINLLPVVLVFLLLIISSRVGSPTAQAQTETPERVQTPAATFNADALSLGAIPDGTALTPLPSYGAPRDVTFTVSGLSGAVTDVKVSFTSGGPAHTFRGDLEAVLKAPGGTPSFLLFSRTGATSTTSFGSGSDLSGPYNFTDTAAGTHWWAVTATPTTPGDYRTVGAGPSATNPAFTNMNAAFSSVANANGVWTLSFRDGASSDTGSISAASLTLTTASVANQHIVDFDGDGKTDFAVSRNTGGGPTGQLTWFVNLNGTATSYAMLWGLNGDIRVPEDYDGDNKTDIAVWRAVSTGQPSGNAFFYILQSQTNTVRIEDFGQNGDDPTVVGDYNGDGKTDVAVYRAGATAGAPSTWFYRTTAGGAVNFVPWGQNGDFPAPGDYDGDGKNDFVVQRNNGGGQARFWMSQTTAGFDSVVFGTPTDVIVPGDYDGDGKTDIATVRGSAGQIVWFVRPSTTGAISGTPLATFGASATDFPVQGDYDGDGKTDVAVWRPSATPGASAFWAQGSTAGIFSVPFGQNGDYPVANYNSH